MFQNCDKLRVKYNLFDILTVVIPVYFFFINKIYLFFISWIQYSEFN